MNMVTIIIVSVIMLMVMVVIMFIIGSFSRILKSYVDTILYMMFFLLFLKLRIHTALRKIMSSYALHDSRVNCFARSLSQARATPFLCGGRSAVPTPIFVAAFARIIPARALRPSGKRASRPACVRGNVIIDILSAEQFCRLGENERRN